MTRTDPFPNPLGWRASGAIKGGLAHYFLRHVNSNGEYVCTICSAASWHKPARLFPERMARRRCRTCERSTNVRGMT